MLSPEQVTVNIEQPDAWEQTAPLVTRVITDALLSQQPGGTSESTSEATPAVAQGSEAHRRSEVERVLEEAIEQYIRPYVNDDGGDIHCALCSPLTDISSRMPASHACAQL